MKKFVLAPMLKSMAFLSLVFLVTGSVNGRTTMLTMLPLFQQAGALPEQQQQDESESDDQPESTSESNQNGEVVEAEPFVVKVAGDSLQLTVTGQWKNVPPRSGMLEAEINVPRTGDDEQDGRLTIMGAGGTIEANIDRWKLQFTQPEGGPTDAKVEEKTIADQKVSLVDITGSFLDAPGGPFSGQPKIERQNYRMLAAIIETENNGNYFVKLYGPKATIDKNADSFRSMIESLKIVD